MIFRLPQFPSVVVTGHVLRELKQVSAGGECPARPWRARAKSDLQLGGPENLASLPPTCPGALALSGVLRRLQQVEEKVLQVKASLFALPLSWLCLCPACALPMSLPCLCPACIWDAFLFSHSSCPGWVPPLTAFPHLSSCLPCVLSAASPPGCLSASLPEGTLTISVTFSFFFLLSRLGCRKGPRTWPTGNFTKRTLRRRRLTLPPCLDTGISHR